MNKKPGVLWAPWRKGYVIQPNKDKSCLFCRVGKEKKDRKNLVVLRSRAGYVILNRFPYNNGHLMVVPNRHIDNLSDLRAEEVLELFSLIESAIEGLKEKLHPEGFNLGINLGKVAGAGIAGHIHIHIIPRWTGDTNFMPLISGTKSLPDSLNSLYQNLSEGIGKIWQKKKKR
ncbi:MAG: HIT family hydrolase [bacterium (Candidatus Ratteibacteria) CG23_combo_of_CG06-09_8_20_14_all_48_7]|uniref:HIT family hydrolase n=1 Tax=bacterium (Candidatus Ratteibacteria) CG23_combo_of_CG06-09_8_20_14_all_48_7 TaxID=2014292 RepID=A0A2G9YBF5_9BACT|nr:MAG: HIT family hydrolase [bacterium (Candidatus Ratteibacteria) CG23_combo_of_CG06-09_8_20_14_all_48_7]